MRLRFVHLLALLALLLSALVPHASFAEGERDIATLTFERGQNRASLSGQYPGLRFSTDGGSWLYYDLRTGEYDAPYPQFCPVLGRTCHFAANGNFLVAPGRTQAIGRIDFTQGTASFVSARFTNSGTVTVEAFTATGQLVTRGQVESNRNTGRLDEVRLTGAGMAYIVISGGANFWAMDDFSTNAPGVVGDEPDETIRTAKVVVVQRATGSAKPGSIMTTTVVARNLGLGAAGDVVVTMPLDSSRVRILDATFSRPGAWVSETGAEQVVFQTGRLGSKGDVVTATLRLEVKGGAPEGGSVGGRFSYSWKDAGPGGVGRSNLVEVPMGVEASSILALTSSPADGGGHTFAGSAFVPGEPVALWYNAPDGRVVALGRVKADADGAISKALAAQGLASGSYSMVAQGVWSEITAVAPFAIP